MLLPIFRWNKFYKSLPKKLFSFFLHAGGRECSFSLSCCVITENIVSENLLIWQYCTSITKPWKWAFARWHSKMAIVTQESRHLKETSEHWHVRNHEFECSTTKSEGKQQEYERQEINTILLTLPNSLMSNNLNHFPKKDMTANCMCQAFVRLS